MAINKYLECGRAVGTHGVRGTLRLESYCDTPDALARLKRLYVKNPDGTFSEKRVRAASVQKSMVLCTLEDVNTLDDAIKLKGTVFYADRIDIKIERNAVFVADILGLDVKDADSIEKYGVLEEVISPGGRDVYVVRDIKGGTFMIPAVDEFIKKIVTDGDDAGIYVKLIEGLRGE